MCSKNYDSIMVGVRMFRYLANSKHFHVKAELVPIDMVLFALSITLLFNFK